MAEVGALILDHHVLIQRTRLLERRSPAEAEFHPKGLDLEVAFIAFALRIESSIRFLKIPSHFGVHGGEYPSREAVLGLVWFEEEPNMALKQRESALEWR